MPDFFKKLQAIKASVENRIENRDHQSTSFSPSAAPNAYWIASFDPSHPLTQEWRRETGAHGWGNAELENYTDSDRNSFFRPAPNGGHCMVLKSIAENDTLTSARLTSLASLGRPRGYLAATITGPSASE